MTSARELIFGATFSQAVRVTTTRTVAFSYRGTAKNDVWNGSGSMGNSVTGKVSAETKDEVTAGSCDYEAESGTTTITSGSSKVVITYDGASKCDMSSTVKWSTPVGPSLTIGTSSSP